MCDSMFVFDLVFEGTDERRKYFSLKFKDEESFTSSKSVKDSLRNLLHFFVFQFQFVEKVLIRKIH